MDITPVLQWSISALLVALAVFLLAKARGAWLEYRPSQQWVRNMLDQIVENVVNAAEQKFMHADSTGKDKLHYALLAAEAQCKLYGLKFDAGVIAPLIEAAVFNLAEKTKTVLDE